VIDNKRSLVVPTEESGDGIPEKNSLLLVPITFENRCKGVISLSRQADKPFTHKDLKVVSVFADQAAVALENARLHREIRKAVMGTVGVLINMIEVKDPSTRGHSERVTQYATTFAERYCLSDSEIESLRLAALLHDIGKVSVPSRILTKPGPLTDEEWKVIRSHPERGLEILRPVESLESVVPIIYHHHERFDGTGYPDGLKGEKIPLCARILSVADAIEAMRSDRPYRRALDLPQVVHELRSGESRQFDPDIAELFLELLQDGVL
jgi:putative nucleotidyltransferase with HDIG domain